MIKRLVVIIFCFHTFSPWTFARSIQVVFHIVYFDPSENIPDILIENQLEIMNYYFRDYLPSNDIRIPIEFRRLTAKPDIEFCLAKQDPLGNPTMGITRTKTKSAFIACRKTGNKYNIMHSSLEGIDIWDPKKYLNIYIGRRDPDCPFAESIYPDKATNSDDGIIIDPNYLGANQSFGHYNLGMTLVHELGHYFGLYHLSGPNDNTNCSGDDFVDDTPIQSGNYLDCPNNSQQSCGTKSMINNIMNLVDDRCMLYFTQGQVDRINKMISMYRSELFNTTCQAFPNLTDFNFTLYQLNDKFFLKSNDDKTIQAEFILYEANGRKIWQKNSLNQFIVSLPDLSNTAGLYILVAYKNSKKESIKFINFNP